MKTSWMIGAALVAAMASLPAHAGHRYDEDYASEVYYDKAKVVDVRPVYEVVRVPSEQRECWREEVEHPGHHSDPVAGMLVGGVIGGVVGHQMGRGRGNKAATAAGAVIGAAVGHRVARNSHHPGYVSEERHCRVSERYYEEERISGYKVTYRYHGRLFNTHMDRDPGKYVRVKVALDPEWD